MREEPRDLSPNPKKVTKVRRRVAFAIGALVVMFLIYRIGMLPLPVPKDPYKRSPRRAFLAVMKALRTHDQAALRRLTSAQGYEMLTAYMPDQSAASYTKIYRTIRKIEAEHGKIAPFLIQADANAIAPFRKESEAPVIWQAVLPFIYGPSGITFAVTHGPAQCAVYFRVGFNGWELDTLRGYDLEPMIRKENGVPVIPYDPQFQPGANQPQNMGPGPWS